MSTALVRTLIRACLTQPNPQNQAEVRTQLVSATAAAWEQTFITLALHRLVPLVTYTLQEWNLTDALPKKYWESMLTHYQEVKTRNTLNLLTLDGILAAMQRKDLHPVLWKGVVLADSFYPLPATRSMADLDFSIPADEMPQVDAVFESLGFQRRDNMETEDAVYYGNTMGILCDVHHRVRLFETTTVKNLTTSLTPKRLKCPSMTVLEPNAMLVHLVVHMDGHLDETGPILIWILDVAYVLRQWRDQLDLARIQQLMPSQDSVDSLMRLVRFLQVEFGEPIPDVLAESAQHYQPYTLDYVLRSRRLTVWGLPSVRGWMRLLACRLGIASDKGRIYPYWRDLMPWSAA
ncbi:nucleotidyltransferase family protein [Leptolyngbya sp. AN02str]|uniref:nucleotidyltransferase family protein n=1 Tax=Leptolyngbya sp. AN02str TaxID=3423363 RepID=UPI003D3147ED